MFMNTEKKTGNRQDHEIDFNDGKYGRFFPNRFVIRDHWLEMEKEWIFGPNEFQADS